MIITQQDVDNLAQFYERHKISFKHVEDDSWQPLDFNSTHYFANNPHLLFPLGFDDYRAIMFHEDETAEEKIAQLGLLNDFTNGLFCMEYEPFFRRTHSGEWVWFEGITHYKYDENKAIKKKDIPIICIS